MTNYMPIVPVGYLDTLDVAGVKNVFILSQFWNNKKYREYYISRKWDTVVLDNALYEDPTATNFEDMMGMARQLDAKQVFVVGPEKLDDGVETGRMTIDILNEYQSEGKLDDNITLMCILHERPTEMLEQWNMIRRYRDVALGISIFSYRLGFDRGSLYRFLGLRSDRYTHAFGWDNLLEMYNLSDHFDSIDSSLCVSAVVNRKKLTDIWQITRNPKMDGFEALPRLDLLYDPECPEFGPDQTDIKFRITRNIQFLTKFANQPWVFKESDLK